jgi:hypothetical protein
MVRSANQEILYILWNSQEPQLVPVLRQMNPIQTFHRVLTDLRRTEMKSGYIVLLLNRIRNHEDSN